MIRILLAVGVLLAAVPSIADAQAVRPGREEIRKNLERILSSGEYETDRPKGSVRETIWGWILRKAREMLGSLADLGRASPGIFWLILIACLATLAAIFVHGGVVLVRALRASRVGAKPGLSKGRSRGDDADELFDRAEEAARESRFIEAIRLCHRAALMGLDRRGLLRFQECLTSGDYRAQLQGKGSERSLFDDLTRVYEPAFFGKETAGGKEYSESRRLARLLAEGAPAR